MCHALCAMLRSQDIQNVELAIGIIRGLMTRTCDDEELSVLRCIQEFLRGHINRGNATWTLEQLELEIYEYFN